VLWRLCLVPVQGGQTELGLDGGENLGSGQDYRLHLAVLVVVLVVVAVVLVVLVDDAIAIVIAIAIAMVVLGMKAAGACVNTRWVVVVAWKQLGEIKGLVCKGRFQNPRGRIQVSGFYFGFYFGFGAVAVAVVSASDASDATVAVVVAKH